MMAGGENKTVSSISHSGVLLVCKVMDGCAFRSVVGGAFVVEAQSETFEREIQIVKVFVNT